MTPQQMARIKLGMPTDGIRSTDPKNIDDRRVRGQINKGPTIKIPNFPDAPKTQPRVNSRIILAERQHEQMDRYGKVRRNPKNTGRAEDDPPYIFPGKVR